LNIKSVILGLFLCLLGNFAVANEPQHNTQGEKEFNPGEMITHHISDAHEWHFFGEHGAIPLPVIIYNKTKGGLDVFSSSHLYHSADKSYNGYQLDHHDHIHAVNGDSIIDFSITKNVASLFISAALLLGIFLTISSRYKKNGLTAPKGVQSFFEPIIIYIRDDVAKVAIGAKYERYLPYLLTIFFFIWFNNLLGLIPGGANLTGNIAVTFTLAIITFLITQFSGNKTYWGHIFNPPGVPHLLKPIIVPIEIVGIFTKPFSLMVRLFANITAGHIIILSLLGLIFIFKHVGASLLSIPFALFMSFLELFVAILQAYIFTLLSAMYFGAAVEEHHHHEPGEEGYDDGYEDNGHAVAHKAH
jgi:F-type H+-transporting ATPase subunit a